MRNTAKNIAVLSGILGFAAMILSSLSHTFELGFDSDYGRHLATMYFAVGCFLLLISKEI